MIKKFKILLFAFLFVIFGFSFTNGYTYQEVGLDSKPSEYDNNFDLTFLKGGGVKTSLLGYGKGVLALNDQTLFWWTPNGLPYLYYYGPDWSVQGFIKKYYVCSPVTGLNSDYPGNCSEYTIDTGGDWQLIFKSFFGTIQNGNYSVYSLNAGSDNQGRWGVSIDICFSNSTKSICFYESCNYNRAGDPCGSNVFNSQNYPSDFSFSKVPIASIGPAPGQAQYGQNIENSSGDYVEFTPVDTDYINYYENTYGFNRSMCYVGTTRLDATYGEIWDTGTGQTSLFDMFTHIYNRLPASDGYEIIGRWIDYWLFNYDQWFNTDHNPKFLLVGSPLAELWEKIYTGFSNPFVGNPAFIYFYMSDLTNNYNGGLQVGSQRYGPALASYCDLKINGSNSYPIATSVVNNVKDQLNTNIGVDLGQYQNPTQGYNGGTTGFWDNNPYTGSSDVNSTFSQFYANLTNLVSGINSSGNGIIPGYILFFFAFAILIRLLKK